MEENKDEYVAYRINTKTHYKVFVNEYAGNKFYKIYFEKKTKNGNRLKIYRTLKFVQCEPPLNGEIIRIKKAFEDNYIDPKNPYNDVCIIVVQDYEKISNDKVEENQAYEKFQETLVSNERDNFDIDNLPF